MELPFEVPAGVELVADLSTTDWIQPRLLPQERSLGVRVGEIIPTGFDAYARVFHPHARATPWSHVAGLSSRNGTNALSIPRCSWSTSSAPWTSAGCPVSNRRWRAISPVSN